MCGTHLHIQMLHICVCMYVHFYNTYVTIMLKMETLIMAGIRSGRSFHMYAVHVHGSCALASCTHTHTHSSAPLCIRHDLLQEYATPTWLTTSLTCQTPISPRAYCCAIIHKTGMSGVRDYMSTCVYTDVSGGASGWGATINNTLVSIINICGNCTEYAPYISRSSYTAK